MLATIIERAARLKAGKAPAAKQPEAPAETITAPKNVRQAKKAPATPIKAKATRRTTKTSPRATSAGKRPVAKRRTSS
jgi:hypothetical protein